MKSPTIMVSGRHLPPLFLLAIILSVSNAAPADETSASGAATAAVKTQTSPPDSNDSEALFQQGKAYANGIGVPRDEAKAFDCYRKSAEMGNLKAQHNLGVMCAAGTATVKPDEKEALKWYRKAADQGSMLSQYALGCMLEEGKGTDKNASEAAVWWRKAADQGHADAQYRLGLLYYLGADGVKSDMTEAAKWLEKAVAQHHAGAANNLGVMYEGGAHVEKSVTEALRLYRIGAEGGNPKAQCNLGRYYSLGIAVDKDPLQAYRWLKRSSKQGDSVATNLLADFKLGLKKEQIAEGERLVAEDEKMGKK